MIESKQFILTFLNFEKRKLKSLIGLPVFLLVVGLLVSLSSAVPANCNPNLPGGQGCEVSGNITYNSITNSTTIYQNTTETDPVFVSQNSSLARTGNCPAGKVVQNTTNGGVQCVTITSDGILNDTYGGYFAKLFKVLIGYGDGAYETIMSSSWFEGGNPFNNYGIISIKNETSGTTYPSNSYFIWNFVNNSNTVAREGYDIGMGLTPFTAEHCEDENCGDQSSCEDCEEGCCSTWMPQVNAQPQISGGTILTQRETTRFAGIEGLWLYGKTTDSGYIPSIGLAYEDAPLLYSADSNHPRFGDMILDDNVAIYTNTTKQTVYDTNAVGETTINSKMANLLDEMFWGIWNEDGLTTPYFKAKSGKFYFMSEGGCYPTSLCYLANLFFASANMTGNLSVGGNSNLYGNLVVEGNLSVKRPYGMFSSTQDQIIAVANTAYPITFNWTEDDYQTYKSNDNANFSFGQSGDYLIELSVIVVTDTNNKHVEIWTQKNGVNIARSNTKVEIENAGTETIISVPFIIDLNMSDKFRIMWASDDAGTKMEYSTNTSYSPETPSIIMTVSKISEITA